MVEKVNLPLTLPTTAIVYNNLQALIRLIKKRYRSLNIHKFSLNGNIIEIKFSLFTPHSNRVVKRFINEVASLETDYVVKVKVHKVGYKYRVFIRLYL